ncbi:MAG: hypothetical protein EOM25_02725 [Deltaproteobacteria bacterium]|nr:hypothetical protein [Deltaproteobacteria bacterium]
MTSTASQGPGPDKGLCRQFKDGRWKTFEDWIAPEVRITVHWPQRPPQRLWAFPCDLEDLASGYALIEYCTPGEMPVPDGIDTHDENGRSEFFFRPGPDPRPRSIGALKPMAPDRVLTAMRNFMTVGGQWDRTGCFHRAGLFDPGTGAMVHAVEDIGRHNCLDRLAAWALRKHRTPDSLVLFVSARITASLATKAARAGFRAVVSRSATTTGAMSIIRDESMSLAAFAREGRFSVFADPLGVFGGAGPT